MNRMPEQDSNSKLDALFQEYRAALPDVDPGAGFMPGLWQRIEARRASSLWIFRRLAQVCVGATLALTLLMGAFLIPRLEKPSPVYSSSYVDELAAEHPNNYVDILTGDIK
jgi:hypothetical protein